MVLARSSPTVGSTKESGWYPPCIYCREYPLGSQLVVLEMNFEETQASQSIAEPLHQIRLHPHPLD